VSQYKTYNEDGTYYYKTFRDIRPYYGIPIPPETVSPTPEGDVNFRKTEGLWWLIYKDANRTNINGEYLEFLQFSHQLDLYKETGSEKPLTVERTNFYIDQPLDLVKDQLKQMLNYKKDEKINVSYNFISTDGKINLNFNMSNDARYNIRDAYYLQQDMKSPDISFFIDNTPIRLPKKYIKELFLEVNKFFYNILIDLERQIFNLESTESIYEAQLSAEWVYEGKDIPIRDKV
ncbi:TPA: hypothetical protein RVU01_004764, partial [Escherichia coli]|nr:hypothetical protein [Escherichia coli]